MLPCFDLPHGKTRFSSQFWLRKVGLDPFQKKVVTQSFDVSWNELSSAKSLLEIVQNSLYGALCNSQQWTQPALALSVPLRGQRHESPVAQFLVVRPLCHESFPPLFIRIDCPDWMQNGGLHERRADCL